MAPLIFADMYNTVAFLSKSDASDGFDQIATAIVDKVNGNVQLQTLINDKKVVVTESIIRQDPYLDDDDGVECFPNAKIFKELARMGYEKPPPKLTFYKAFFFAQWKFLIHIIVQCLSAKRTTWNEFSSSMASAIIRLTTGRKFNFSKYIFDSMVRNVDSPSKFLMYPCFIQVVLDHQVDDMTTHNTRYKSSALTQKVLANMRRVRKGFSGVKAPQFDSMLVQSQSQAKEGVEVPITHAQPSITSAPSPIELQDTTPTTHDTPPPYQPPTPYASPLQDQPTPLYDSHMPLLTTLMETSIDADEGNTLVDIETEKAKLIDEKIAQKLHDEEVQKVAASDEQERADMGKALELQRQLDARENDIDWSTVTEQVKERQSDSIKRYQDLKKKPVSVAQARKNMMIYLKNMAGYKIEFFKGMTYDEIRSMLEREYNKVQTLFKCKIDKKKRFKLTLEVFRDIFQICPRIEDQDFDALPSEEDIVSFLRELGHTRVINSLNDVSKAYKTYLGYATGTIPPKVARKFRKAYPSKKDSVPIPADKEPVQKGKRVKRSVKKYSTTPTTGIVIKEPYVETQSKRKEKVDVTHGKGIDLLFEVALTEEYHMKEVRKKSLRDFHKSHPSGSGVLDVTKDESTESKSESWGNDDDDSNDEEGSERENNNEEHESDSEQDTDGSESVSEYDQQDDDDEVKDDDKDDDNDDNNSECDEDRGMDSDDSIPSPLPTTKTKNIPPSILDFALVFRFNDKVIALEKDVAELKNDPLHTQVTTLIDDHLDTMMGATREEFMNFLPASLTDRITEQVRSQLPQILPEEVSNFASPVIEKMIEELLNQVNLAKRSRDDKDKDEGPTAGSDRRLKKRKTSKDAEPTISLKTKDSSSRSSNDTKSQPKSSRKSVYAEEPEFEVGDTDTPQDQEGNQGKTPQKGPTQNWLKTLVASTSAGKSSKEFDELMRTPIDFSSYILNGLKIENLTQEILLGTTFRLLKGTRSNYAELKYNFEECYKSLSEKLDWENPKGDDYPFDLSKPLHLITHGNHQSVPVEFFINNDL
nr:hypothetical protein [Tanacetum cinerariifolium]